MTLSKECLFALIHNNRVTMSILEDLLKSTNDQAIFDFASKYYTEMKEFDKSTKEQLNELISKERGE
jgi:hypothetical protein